MLTAFDRSLAASQAASGVPANKPANDLSGATTMQKQCFEIGTSDPARSTTRRTGVHLLPMTLGFVMTAPSQWKKLRIRGPAMPGNKYLFPPENPTTS